MLTLPSDLKQHLWLKNQVNPSIVQKNEFPGRMIRLSFSAFERHPTLQNEWKSNKEVQHLLFKTLMDIPEAISKSEIRFSK